jgi:hypothetical protein
LAWASRAQAQDTTDTIKQFTKFSVAADHDGANTDGYRLYLNGAVWQVLPVSALVGGTITFSQFGNGIVKGVYVFYVEAYNAEGVAVSYTLTLTVTTGNPTAPGKPRIIKALP